MVDVKKDSNCTLNFNTTYSKLGNFSSPNWPFQYPNNQKCVFNFKGERFETINITFFTFDLGEPFEKG